MAGLAEFIVNDEPVEGYGRNVSASSLLDEIHSNALDYGAIVYRKDLPVAKNITKTLILYFPNTWHSNTHGRTSATNAELAGQYIINGKWREWWYRQVASFMWDAEKELNRKVEILFSKEMKKSRDEWNRIAHTKDYQKQWKAFKSRLAKLRSQHKIAKSISEEKMPDFWALSDITGKSLKEQTEWVQKQKASFLARKKQADVQRVQLWQKIKSLSSKANVRALKKSLINQNRTEEWRLAIEAINEEINSITPANIREKRKSFRLQDKMVLLDDPWSFGVNAERALRSIGNQLVVDMKYALQGAKAPELSERTMKNRRYRGNPETPALDETGEFIESLTFDII